MTYYDSSALMQMYAESSTVEARSARLSYRVITHRFTNPAAHDIAMQGFIRRLNTLTFCVENVFRLMPPESTAATSRRDSYECMINIQAFVFNVFGSLDNLAWILVHEKGITDVGKPLRKHAVGLRSQHPAVRAALSPVFDRYLSEKSEWFEQLGGFRDALAHRIPLYIPPTIPLENGPEYEKIQHLKVSASPEEYDCLDERERKLYCFVPVMQSHTETGTKTINFHPQMLNDFALVTEIANMTLNELGQHVVAAP